MLKVKNCIYLINFISLQAEVMEIVQEFWALQDLQVLNEIAISYQISYIIVAFIFC